MLFERKNSKNWELLLLNVISQHCKMFQDQATEVILTLGQAFEVAYQMALKDKLSSQAIRSHSENQLSVISNANSSAERSPERSDTSTNNASAINKPNSESKPRPLPRIPYPSTERKSALHSNAEPSSNSKKNCGSNTSSPVSHSPMKLLATHGRSHSVNDIKINGNRLKLVPTSVEEMKLSEMKPGSRAPIALSEEL